MSMNWLRKTFHNGHAESQMHGKCEAEACCKFQNMTLVAYSKACYKKNFENFDSEFCIKFENSAIIDYSIAVKVYLIIHQVRSSKR